MSAAQLDASASVPGIFSYEPAAGAVLTAGTHALVVTFTPTEATVYSSTTASVSITVNQATPLLTWAAPAAISYGVALSSTQLDAAASVSGSFAYVPAAGTLLTAGSQTLSVTFTPADSVDYTMATGSVNLTIDKATPILTWVPNDPIAVGVPLTQSQLDAQAFAPANSTGVAGSFVYTPGIGAQFDTAGPVNLSVAFTPVDMQDFTTANASITRNASAFGVVAWGDSLTAGGEGFIDTGAYPSELRQLIALPVVNRGVPDLTSTEIAVGEGGVVTTVSVAGGVIPPSGSVQVTFPSGYMPLNVSGPKDGVPGTLLGVHGVLTVPSGICTFTRSTPGSSVDAPGNPVFAVDTPYAAYLPVFWEGRNNYAQSQQVLSDIAAQVNTVPSGQTFLVMSVININDQPEWVGNPNYKIILALNSQLANIYGSHYLDIREVLVSSYNPTLITDVSDYQHDEVPTSLRAIIRNETLVDAIGPADTSLVLSAPSDNSSFGHILTIDTGANAENVEITAVNGNTVTVVRNFGGLDTSHAAGAPVVETDEIHLNADGYQIVAGAVAQFLSAYEVETQPQGDFNPPYRR